MYRVKQYILKRIWRRGKSQLDSSRENTLAMYNRPNSSIRTFKVFTSLNLDESTSSRILTYENKAKKLSKVLTMKYTKEFLYLLRRANSITLLFLVCFFFCEINLLFFLQLNFMYVCVCVCNFKIIITRKQLKFYVYVLLRGNLYIFTF